MSKTAKGAVDARPPGPSIADFERLHFDVASFDHAAHVFVAWSYLQGHDLLTAIRRYGDTLRRLTKALGIPDKYHETITWFFLIAVAERNGHKQQNWAEFRISNPELFATGPSLIRKYYSEERLNGALARGQFVFPDLAPSALN